MSTHAAEDRDHLRGLKLEWLRKVRRKTAKSIEELTDYLGAIDDVIAEKERDQDETV